MNASVAWYWNRLRCMSAAEVLHRAQDAARLHWRSRFAAAWKDGARLRFVGRLDLRGATPLARVGLEALPADDPLAGGSGTDNRVAIWSDRYARQPLVIQGPGAGADVTAAALLDDALRIAGLQDATGRASAAR